MSSLWDSANWAPVVAFSVCAALLRWIVGGGAHRVALDQPNERSLHSRPISRLGGVGILCGTLAGWAFVSSALTLALFGGAVLIGVVSLIEDVRGVPMAIRFSAHFLAAGYFVNATLAGSLGWPVLLVVVVGIVWVINLYNFMDGSDGLAGGMTVFGFGTFGIAACLSGAPGFALASASVAGSAAAFLIFNFAPAKIFMGDAGSIPLGFLAASCGLFGWRNELWPAWFPLLVFSPFLVDASVTIVARLLRREKIWRAHRSHYYQRLVLMGWGHRRVAIAEYGLMVLVSISALVAVHSTVGVQCAVLAGWVAVYLAMLRKIDSRWRRFTLGAGGVTG
jgi:UDP-N-acetylmuramyl pentapeptide phosphotransferase/UDP-N-acetylglucosamine-1-phosphate transferase